MILKLYLMIRRHIQLRSFSIWGGIWIRKSSIWLARASVFLKIWRKIGSLVWSYIACKCHRAHVFNSSCSLLGIFHLNVSMGWTNIYFLLQSVIKRWWWCQIIFVNSWICCTYAKQSVTIVMYEMWHKDSKWGIVNKEIQKKASTTNNLNEYHLCSL